MKARAIVIGNFLLFWLFIGSLHGKVLIATHVFNETDFIYWQYKTVKTFVKDDYEYVVFNDARDQTFYFQIHEICRQLNIHCIDVPQTIHKSHDPSKACADTLQYILNSTGFDFPGIVMMIDPDMFLIQDLSIEKMLNGYDLAANPQYRTGNHGIIEYFFPNLIILNMKTLPDKHALNFDLGEIDGVCVDSGGFTHYFLKNHPNLMWIVFNCLDLYNICQNDYELIDNHFVEFFLTHPKLFQQTKEPQYGYNFVMNFSILHFRAGSNWWHMNETTVEDKKRILFDVLEEALSAH